MVKKKSIKNELNKIINECFLAENYSKVRRLFFDEEIFFEKNNQKSIIDKLGLAILNGLILVSILIVLGYYLPGLMEKLIPRHRHEIVKANGDELEMIIWQPALDERIKRRIKPEYDLNLGAGKWLLIPSASIEAQIMTNLDIENKKEVNKILDQGVYAYPNYDEIGWLGKTVILAGHHFNMIISEKDGKKNFQNLSKVKINDKVVLTDDYKKWQYKIYKIEKATTISEKEADLIMYTCVFWWDSDLRLFVYGKIEE